MKVYIIFLAFIIYASCDYNPPDELLLTLDEEDKKYFDEFLTALLNYIKQSQYVALHKFRKGIALNEPDEEQWIFAEAEEQAKKFQVPIGDVKNFLSDIFNAGKLLECVLTYNWYSRAYFDDQIHPYTEDVNIDHIRKVQGDLQRKLINCLAAISHIKTTKTCAQDVAIMVFNQKESKHHLFRIALQRAMGNFCKVILPHN